MRTRSKSVCGSARRWTGTITAIRFYKGPANTGPHVGHLWTNTGALLATITFSGETASGWQQATSEPAGRGHGEHHVCRVVSHGQRRLRGHLGYFQSSGVTNGPLQALATGVDGPNGVFVYGPSAFPTGTFSAANYWVDVVLTTAAAGDTTPPSVTSVAPPAGATGVALTTAVTATFSEDLNANTVTASTFELRDPANLAVQAPVTYNAATRTATLQPLNPLSNSTVYTVIVRGGTNGVKDVAGNALAPTSPRRSPPSGRRSPSPTRPWRTSERERGTRVRTSRRRLTARSS